MVKKKQTTQKRTSTQSIAISRRERVFESDGTYLLKLVAFVLLGTFWLKFHMPVSWMGIPMTGVPVGLLIGLLLVNRFEKYQEDRKIWYAILIVVTIICYFVPAGIVL